MSMSHRKLCLKPNLVPVPVWWVERVPGPVRPGVHVVLAGVHVTIGGLPTYIYVFERNIAEDLH